MTLEQKMEQMAQMMATFQTQLVEKDKQIETLKAAKPVREEKPTLTATRKNGMITITFPEQKGLVSKSGNPMLAQAFFSPTSLKDENGCVIVVSATIMPQMEKKSK